MDGSVMVDIFVGGAFTSGLDRLSLGLSQFPYRT